MELEQILSLIGGGAGVFLLKLYNDWRAAKRGDKTDIVGAWQKIADRELGKYERMEARVEMLEKTINEQEQYIKVLVKHIFKTGKDLPEKESDGG